MKRLLPWDEADEVAFECEPGTLTEGKLQVIKDLGVTRLSLGIENFDDEILKVNGRAHTSKEIGPAYRFARSIGFPQINIDLIAGMVGELTIRPTIWRTTAKWPQAEWPPRFIRPSAPIRRSTCTCPNGSTPGSPNSKPSPMSASPLSATWWTRSASATISSTKWAGGYPTTVSILPSPISAARTRRPRPGLA